MQFRQYTKTKFIEAVATSTSIRQVLLKLGVNPSGGNYRTAKDYIAKLGLDTSHFLGQAWARNRTVGPKRDIQEYLSNKVPITSYKLKLKLLQSGTMQHKCSRCLRTEWFSIPIPLELHHVDGDGRNNGLDNLVLLCPNCHAMTDNYRSKNCERHQS